MEEGGEGEEGRGLGGFVKGREGMDGMDIGTFQGSLDSLLWLF